MRSSPAIPPPAAGAATLAAADRLPVLLLAGGLAVGLIAQTASWLGDNSQDVLFSGQSGVPDLTVAWLIGVAAQPEAI